MPPTTRDRNEMPGAKLGGDPNVMGPPGATDLAKQDGRAEARELDREQARGELLHPAAELAPEVPPGAEKLVAWDVSPDATGGAVVEELADDENQVPAEMAEEGLGEAEQELRRAAARVARPSDEPPR